MTKRAEKQPAMMRSFYCPNLVRIESNANFLSPFQCSVTGVTKFGEPVGKELS